MQRTLYGADDRGCCSQPDRKLGAGPAARSLRMPLGLILLSRGWISHRELQEALQRSAALGRAGSASGCAACMAFRRRPSQRRSRSSGTARYCPPVHGRDQSPRAHPAFLRRRYGLALLRQGPDRALYLAGKYRAGTRCRARGGTHAARAGACGISRRWRVGRCGMRWQRVLNCEARMRWRVASAAS